MAIDIRDLFDVEEDHQSSIIRTIKQEINSHQIFLDDEIGEPKKYRDLINLLYVCSENTEFNY